MSAFACLAVAAASELADLADLLTAMASQALLGNRGHFNAFLFDQAKPHAGMVQSAATSASTSTGRSFAGQRRAVRRRPGGGAEFLELDRQVQDQYSIRCAPHVIGVLRDVIAWVQDWITIEINSS